MQRNWRSSCRLWLATSLSHMPLETWALTFLKFKVAPKRPLSTRLSKLPQSATNTPILTEDVSLCFNAYKGLPSPYIKDFLSNVGRDGPGKWSRISRTKQPMLKGIFAFCEGPDAEPITFVGWLNGQIMEPRGKNMFEWDPVFQPENFETTFAEMSAEDKNGISHRGNALAMVK